MSRPQRRIRVPNCVDLAPLVTELMIPGGKQSVRVTPNSLGRVPFRFRCLKALESVAPSGEYRRSDRCLGMRPKAYGYGAR